MPPTADADLGAAPPPGRPKAAPAPSEGSTGAPAPSVGAESFAEQIAFLRGKLNLPTERWDDIWQSAHDRAFVVAGATKADLLQDLHLAVERAAAGSGFAAFKNDFEAIVAKHGWTGWTGEGSPQGRAWRAGVIYDTNLATSHAAGRWRQLTDPAFLKLRPYWRYRHADGLLHPRPLHVAWNGLTLPHDHAFWRTHFPPNGWGCRCKVFAQAGPGTFTEPPAGWEAGDGIDAGFGYAPGSQVGVPLREMVEAKLVTYPPAIAKVLSKELQRYIDTASHPTDFAAAALADQRHKVTLWLGFVATPQALSAATDVDLTHYTVTLTSDTVRHAVASHQFDGAGQRPVVAADFAQVAALVNAPDTVAPGDAPGTLKLSRQLSGPSGTETVVGVFEVRSGKKSRTLELLTLYVKTAKKKGGAP